MAEDIEVPDARWGSCQLRDLLSQSNVPPGEPTYLPGDSTRTFTFNPRAGFAARDSHSLQFLLQFGRSLELIDSMQRWLAELPSNSGSRGP